MVNLPCGVKVENLIDDLRILSWEAADILLFYSQKIKDSEFNSEILINKNIHDPTTIADLKVNQLIINTINEKYKDISWGILSEENVKIDPNQFEISNDWLWVLDPLDGTKDFIQGTSNFAIHLALNYKQKPYFGIVVIPRKNELWIANGKEVWCEGRDRSQKQTNINLKKNLQDMTIVSSKNHNNKTLKTLIEKIGFKKKMIMGSIGCKIASILRGESDIYICLSLPGRSSPRDWDFAAPEAILKKAGGAITNLDNEELSYGKSNFEQGGIIVASNNKIEHKSLCLEIKKVIEKYDIFPL